MKKLISLFLILFATFTFNGYSNSIGDNPEIKMYKVAGVGELKIETTNFKYNDATITIYNTMGQLVKEKKIYDLQTVPNQTLDIITVEQGFYYVTFQSKDYSFVTKIYRD